MEKFKEYNDNLSLDTLSKVFESKEDKRPFLSDEVSKEEFELVEIKED